VLVASALCLAGCSSHGGEGGTDAAHSSGGASAGSSQDGGAGAGSTADGGSSNGGSSNGGSSDGGSSNGGSGSGGGTARPSLAGDGVVSRTAFTSSGRTWPLTVSEGTLFCEGGTQVIFTTSDGTAYGVNAAAQGAGEWDDIRTIQANDHGKPADLSDLAEAGQQLC
jgi:hypothetical protein